MTTEIRVSAPDALAPVPFNIPQPFKTELANGLGVVVFEDNRLPLVSFHLAFFSGDVDDPSESIGLNSAMVTLLMEGTENYSSKDFAEKIERLGASIGAGSTDDFTTISASALSLYTGEMFDLMAEVLFRPTFPADELDLYKRNTLEHLKFERSQPNFLVGEQVARLLYGEHPYGRAAKKPEDVEKLTREQLLAWRERMLVPNNAVLIAVGDVSRTDLLEKIETTFGPWKSGEVSKIRYPEITEQKARSLTIVDRPGSAQSNIVLTNLALRRDNPDYFAVLVMNQVLGAGASSRIFMNLREEKGYTYGAYTRFDCKQLSGDFEATAEVRTSVTGDSLKEFFYELERIRVDEVRDDELVDAKNFLTGVFPLRAETQEGLTGLLVGQQLHRLPDDYLQTYRDNIEAINAADVLRVASKYIHPEKIAIVIVGDAEEILPQVMGYAEAVEIFDTDGNAKAIADYETDGSGENIDVNGKWNLVIDFQGQKLPVLLILEQTDDGINGKLETMLGNGEISNAKLRGNKLTATAVTDVQGQTVEFLISGVVVGDSMEGTITAPIVADPLVFTGTRSL